MLKQVQSFLGKFNFNAACAKPSGVFVSRLLRSLQSIYKSPTAMHSVPHFAQNDLKEFAKLIFYCRKRAEPNTSVILIR